MNRRTMKNLGLLLALILIFSLLPLGSLSAAAEEPSPDPDTEIASASLSLTLPQAGQPVQASVSPAAGSSFTVSSASWLNASGAAPESFEEGQSYYAEIRLVPNEGSVFTESTSVSIDSLGVRSAQLQEDGSLLVVTENYTIPETTTWYNVWVSGVQVSSKNLNDILGDGGKAKYDPSTGTLTLNDPAITTMHEPSGALILADGVNLTVEGSADLGETEADMFIFVHDGNLTLKGDFSATVTGNGIVCDRNLTAQEGKITVESTGVDKAGVWVEGDLLVNFAELTATGTSAGIHVKGGFNLKEGVIKATATGEGCDSEIMKHGIFVGEAMLMEGGDVTATGETTGIYGAGGITINGGITAATGGEIGIFVAEGNLDLQNDTIRVTADGQSEQHGAIYAPQILLGDKLGVKEPVGGKVGNDKQHITLKDGTHISKHALIENGYITYTVSFETFGGPEVESQVVSQGAQAEKPEDPVLEGYSFEGWYRDIAGGSGPYDFSAPVTENITLQAYWSCPMMAGVIDTEGNLGVGGLVSFGDAEYQTQVSFQAWREGGPYWVGCKPATGFSFDHWEDEAGNTLSQTESSFSFDAKEGGKSFFAVFRQEGFTITFDGNGGQPATQTLVTGADGKLDPDELEALTNATSREGYGLTGWARTPDGDPFGIGAEVFTEPTTVYAVWTSRVYNVTFVANGGTETPAQSVRHGQRAQEPEDPTRRNYLFDGWYIDKALSRLFDFSTPITSDLVLYAKWARVVKYTVVSGGGSIYGKSSGNDLPIVIRRTPKDAECYKHFINCKVDGGILTLGRDYTAHAGENGGTVVTLTAEFLSQLNSGTHIISFTFDDGKATTGLTVKAGTGGGGSRRGSGGSGGNPETGDFDPLVWGGLLILSGLGLGAVALGGRKLRRAAKH